MFFYAFTDRLARVDPLPVGKFVQVATFAGNDESGGRQLITAGAALALFGRAIELPEHTEVLRAPVSGLKVLPWAAVHLWKAPDPDTVAGRSVGQRQVAGKNP